MQCTVPDTFSSDGSSFTADVQGSYFYSIFTDEKIGLEKVWNVPRVMQLVKRCWTVVSKPPPPPCSDPQQVF